MGLSMVRAAVVAFLVALLPSHALAPDGLHNRNQGLAETGQLKGLVAVAEVDPPPNDVGDVLLAWDRIKRSNDVSELQAFVARYKDAFLANLARRRIEQLESQRAVQPSVAAPPVPLPPSPSAAGLILVHKKPLHTHYSKKSRRRSIAQPRRRETATCRCYRISARRVHLAPRLKPAPNRTLAKGTQQARRPRGASSY